MGKGMSGDGKCEGSNEKNRGETECSSDWKWLWGEGCEGKRAGEGRRERGEREKVRGEEHNEGKGEGKDDDIALGKGWRQRKLLVRKE